MVPVWILLAWTAGSFTLIAQDPGTSFREFQNELIPTPDQLLRKLSKLQGVKLPQSQAQKLKELGEKFLAGMTPDQKKILRDLAEKYKQGQTDGIPPNFRKLADEIQEQLGQGNQPFELKDLLDKWPDDLDFPQTSRNPNRPETANRGNREDWRSGNPALPGEAGPSLTEQDPPKVIPSNQVPLIDLDQAARIAERFKDSISQIPQEGRFEPNPDLFDRADQKGNYSSGDPRESIGNRFDRMIMNAVENQLSESGDSRSPIAQAVNDMFGGMVDRVHTRMNRQDWSNNGNRRSQSAVPSWDNRLGQRSAGLSWPRFDSMGDVNATGSSSWFFLVAMGLTLIGIIAWLGRRVLSNNKTGSRGFLSRRNFRVPKIGTTDEMIRAVDGFLLSRFGKPSSWWHSRRAEVALCHDSPDLGNRIGQLVDCYEYARYSEVGNSLSNDQIQECSSILRDLASRRPTRDDPPCDSELRAADDRTQ